MGWGERFPTPRLKPVLYSGSSSSYPPIVKREFFILSSDVCRFYTFLDWA